MTKKDFEAIAHVLDANSANIAIVLDMADMLAEGNPRFNRALFVQASTKKLSANLAATARMIERA